MQIGEEVKKVEAEADILYSEQEVEAAIDRMAKEITGALAGTDPLVLCVLIGGVIPTGKLLPRLRFPLTLDSIHATRYRGGLSGSDIEWILKPRQPLQGRTVLVIDDVLDEGITLQAICDYCKDRGAKAVYSAVLVNKLLDRAKPHRADFLGLQADDRYLFGYGMDYKGYLRNAAGIYACKDS
jgi:hypoxanthine phosphoribosyltransferase